MMLLIFLFNQLLAQNITEQKANYEKLLDTQELFFEFGLDLLYNFSNFLLNWDWFSESFNHFYQ